MCHFITLAEQIGLSYLVENRDDKFSHNEAHLDQSAERTSRFRFVRTPRNNDGQMDTWTQSHLGIIGATSRQNLSSVFANR